MEATPTQVFIDNAWEHARKVLARDGAIDFLTIVVNRAEAQIIFVPHIDVDKATFARLLPLVVEQYNADLVICVSEAWMATTTIEGRKSIPDNLEDYPGRQEIVVVQWREREGGSSITQTAPLIREPNAAPAIGELRPAVPASSARFLDEVFGTPRAH